MRGPEHRRYSEVMRLSVALALVVVMAACSQTRTGVKLPPLQALHVAVDTLLNAPNFSLKIVTLQTTPAGSNTLVENAVIERPDRISLESEDLSDDKVVSRTEVVAIGSTGYLKVKAGWTVVHHRGESTNYTNDVLLYVYMLRRAAVVVRNGSSFVVPTDEATRLLVTTGLPYFQRPVEPSVSASAEGGELKSVVVHVGSGLPIVGATTAVSRIGSSPEVGPPPRNQIVSASP